MPLNYNKIKFGKLHIFYGTWHCYSKPDQNSSAEKIENEVGLILDECVGRAWKTDVHRIRFRQFLTSQGIRFIESFVLEYSE